MPGLASAGDDTTALAVRALKAARGQFVSGEELGRALGLSRNAIWKQMETLRQLGYQVQSIRGLGHRLVDVPDVPLPWEVMDGLATRRIGRPVWYMDTTTSTQDVARHWGQVGAAEGALVVATEQTSGRGRMRRPYFTPRGGLWFSLVLRPARPPLDILALSLAASLAVQEGIRAASGLTAVLKWPNDVLLGERKVAGVMVEFDGDQDRLHQAVLGVGINVNLDAEAFPAELRDRATSLKLELGRPLPLVPTLRCVLEALDRHYERFLEGGSEAVCLAWRSAPNMLGREVRVISPPDTWEGTAVELDRDCALLVRLASGDLRRVAAGDIELLPGVERLSPRA